jgi:hypothetical protein
MADNIYGEVPLDYQPELQNINQQQKLSQMLLQQGMQQPQGQMISGRYVAPAFTQYLTPLFAAYAGSKGMETAEQKQLELAKTLRQGKSEALGTFQKLMSNPETRNEAMQYATQSPFLQGMAQELMKPQKLGEGENLVMPSIGGGAPINLAAGSTKYHAPLQIDTGTSIEIRDPRDPTKLLQTLPKHHVFAPHANQLVPVAGGFAEYNPNSKTLTPIGGAQGGATGSPTGALMPPLPANIQKELIETNQQTSIINDAIKGVEKNRQYFGGKYAAPELLGGEIGQAAMNAKLPEGAVEARSNVFNTASAVIKERAGTAQTPSEKTIIMRFLPSIYDNDATVIKKLNAYNKYISSKAAGTTAVPNAIPTYQGQPKQNVVPNLSVNPVASTAAPIYATDGKTRIMSTDGGNTWQPAGGQ